VNVDVLQGLCEALGYEPANVLSGRVNRHEMAETSATPAVWGCSITPSLYASSWTPTPWPQALAALVCRPPFCAGRPYLDRDGHG
jgi:hypothetical protein